MIRRLLTPSRSRMSLAQSDSPLREAVRRRTLTGPGIDQGGVKVGAVAG